MALQDCGKPFYCQYYVKSSQSTVDFHTTDYFTAPLVSFIKCRSGEPAKIAASLPDDGAFWNRPDFSQAEKELRADPRYGDWVRKTQL